jgi:hypothetical protein
MNIVVAIIVGVISFIVHDRLLNHRGLAAVGRWAELSGGLEVGIGLKITPHLLG